MAKAIPVVVLLCISASWPFSDLLACKCEESRFQTNLRARPGPGETVGIAADRVWVRALNWEGGEPPDGWLHTPDGKRFSLTPGQFQGTEETALWSYLLPEEAFSPGSYIVELNPGLGTVWLEGAERISFRDPVPLKATERFKGALAAWEFHRKAGGEADALGSALAKRAVAVEPEDGSEGGGSCSTGKPSLEVVFGLSATHEELTPLVCVRPESAALQGLEPICDLIPAPDGVGRSDSNEFTMRLGRTRICDLSAARLRKGTDNVSTWAMDWSGAVVVGSEKVFNLYWKYECKAQIMSLMRSVLRPEIWIPAALLVCAGVVGFLVRRKRKRKQERANQDGKGGVPTAS